MRAIPLTLLALVALAGCATLNEDQCRTGNWAEIGQADGAQGRSSDYLAQHAKACEEFGVVPDRAEWERGRQSGLTAYCTPANAYRIGRDGRSLSPVCPPESLSALQSANDRGRRYHEITQDISSARARVAEIERQIVAEADEGRRGALLGQLQVLNANILMLEARRRSYDRL